MSRLRKQADEENVQLLAIANVGKPKDLSPMLLGVVGDRLLAAGKPEKAEPLFVYLKGAYPKSDWVDFAYVGLGNIAFLKNDYPKALAYFKDGSDASQSGVKMRELTLGQAQCLLALNQDQEARKLFLDISGRREWKGEATAQAVYSLGEIEQKAGRYAEANAYFQRVCVAYQKFLPWVAKAYIQSASCLKKLGKTQEALGVYKEMLANEKLKTFPETEQARKEVETLGGKA